MPSISLYKSLIYEDKIILLEFSAPCCQKASLPLLYSVWIFNRKDSCLLSMKGGTSCQLKSNI